MPSHFPKLESRLVLTRFDTSDSLVPYRVIRPNSFPLMFHTPKTMMAIITTLIPMKNCLRWGTSTSQTVWLPGIGIPRR